MSQARASSVAVLASAWLATAALADPPPAAPAPELRAVRKAGGDRGPKLEVKPSDGDALRNARRAQWQALRRDLKAPSELSRPVRDALRLHAQRIARLERIQALAEAAHDKPALERVTQLREREDARHRERLARAWPAPPPARAAQPRPAQPDDDEDDKGEREGEDEEEREDNQP